MARDIRLGKNDMGGGQQSDPDDKNVEGLA